MKLSHIAILLLTACSVAACRQPDIAQRDSIARGRIIAQKDCSGCHRVSRDQPAPPPSARGPSFIDIVKNPNVDRKYLRSLASEFYFPMPAFRLRDEDQEDVISYMLRPQK